MVDFKQKCTSLWLKRVQPGLRVFVFVYWEKSVRKEEILPGLADIRLKPCSIFFTADVPLAMNIFSPVLTYLSLGFVNYAGQMDCSYLGESWKERSLK